MAKAGDVPWWREVLLDLHGETQMKILAVLQNQWFKNPERVKAMIARRPDLRRDYIARFLFAGYIEEVDKLVSVTGAGLAAIGGSKPKPMTSAETIEMWCRTVGGAAKMLRALVDLHPNATTREGLGAALNLAISGGTFQTYLSRLKSNGLIHVEGDKVWASDDLFK